jgi:hypothetical protein
MLGLAGCGVTEQSVFPQLTATSEHDRYLPGNVERVSKLITPWLDQHHCLFTSRIEGGVTWIDCTYANNQRFHVVLTPWQKDDVVFTRIHVEPDRDPVPGGPAVDQRGAQELSKVFAELVSYVDRLNTGPPVTSLQQARSDQPPPVKDLSEEGRALERFQKLRGKVVRDSNMPGAPVVMVDLHSTKATDEDVALLRNFPAVTKLNLYGTRVTDAGMASLGALPLLQTLYLNQTEVGDAGLEYLSGLKNLRELGLFRARVTDRGLEKLQRVQGLQVLVVSGRQISDAGLVYIKGMPNLRELNIRDTAVTDAGVADLKRALPRLVVLR